jgi:intracellular septation protein
MKFLFDLFPVIFFFVSFKWAETHVSAAQALCVQFLSVFIGDGAASAEVAPILLATAITIVASIVQIGYLLISRKKIDAMLWVSFIIVCVFGGLTIYFHNENFIKWKPTILYWCYGMALALGQFVFKKNLIRSVMESQVQLPEPVWTRLGLAWIAYFLVMGVLNLYVAFQFPTNFWVNFKLISMVAIMPAFIIVQSVFLAKYMKDPA